MSDGIAINQSFSRFARSANNNPINLLLSSSLSKVNRNGVQCSGQSVTETGNPFPYNNKIMAVASCYIRPSCSSSNDYVRRRRLLFSIDALQGQRLSVSTTAAAATPNRDDIHTFVLSLSPTRRQRETNIAGILSDEKRKRSQT
jgi:hypothetical protein